MVTPQLPIAAECRSLLDLPAELRLEVYAYYFASDATLPTPPLQTSPLALALTCQQLYHEMHALAFASTTFRTSAWRLADLRTRLRAVRADYMPLITRLEVRVGLFEFLRARQSLGGLQLAGAGLAGVEELHITFVGARGTAFREDMMLSNLEVLLWRTVAHCANRRLRKIRIVHGALIRRCDIVKLGAGMRRRLEYERWMRLRVNRTVYEEGAWRVEEDVEEGRCRLVKGGRDGQAGREVVLLFGETIREAEMYREVQKELLQEITDEVGINCGAQSTCSAIERKLTADDPYFC